MKKVLLIHNILWSHYKAKVFSSLARLTKDKYQLMVLQIALTENTRKSLGQIDYSIHDYNYKLLFETSYQETSIWSRTKAIIAHINAFKPDILVLPGYNDPAYVFTMLLARAKGIKLITTADSTKYDKPRHWFSELAKRMVLRLPHRFLCYGARSQDYLLDLGVRPENIYVRVQASDNTYYRDQFKKFKESGERVLPELKPRNFIFVGRLIHIKGVDTLLKAFAECIHADQRAEHWGLLILGDGSEANALKSMTGQLAIEKNVTFVGAVNWVDLPKFYASSDVFVIPSRSEPWGLVINEAMLCELPVLVSDRCGAVPELVQEGVNGFTFDPERPDVLAGLMLKFIQEKADAVIMGQRSLELISAYTPERAAIQMISAFDSLVT